MKNILDSKNLILSGFIFKVLVGTFFASFVLTDLFMPFVSFFVADLENPYKHFLDVNTPQNFPYPALMLFIMSAPVFIAELFVDLQSLPQQVSFLIYRLPLLLADFGNSHSDFTMKSLREFTYLFYIEIPTEMHLMVLQ